MKWTQKCRTSEWVGGRHSCMYLFFTATEEYNMEWTQKGATLVYTEDAYFWSYQHYTTLIMNNMKWTQTCALSAYTGRTPSMFISSSSLFEKSWMWNDRECVTLAYTRDGHFHGCLALPYASSVEYELNTEMNNIRIHRHWVMFRVHYTFYTTLKL